MKKIFAELELKYKLAIVAVLLGVVALFAGDPYGGTSVKVNVKEIALSTIKDSDKINPATLADWIIQGKADYILVDLRAQEKYSEYSLPEAENIPLVELPEAELLRNQKIILFSDDEVAAAQGWFILKAKNYKSVYILEGGLNGWKDKVLYPKVPANPTKDQLADLDKKRMVAQYFGGDLVTEVASTEIKTEVNSQQPKITPQSTQTKTTGKVTAPKKKKREGC
ncbi:MAG: rhodanese-like domain-containing protein [Ignavibacterium sp.]|uniref:rhodanese-like domain-containing protein n=1 Tax=Ignavibacterium album TaxID=591197 RepID=UPI0026ECECC2|nr:rhodanese-like domain-containing protein [Ignavibacterium album]MCA2004950.1 rhodanese-like domain-containing protein [Ignavibacterium sp.]MCX8107021.1 rhodanese-like domain-containing protein [Ignavibacterium album]